MSSRPVIVGRTALVTIVCTLAVGVLSGQIRGVVLDSAGRPDSHAFVELTGARVYRRVGLTGDARFIFRDVVDTGAMWAQAFDGSRFSPRVRVTLRDTSLQLAIRWPRPGGIVAQRTLFTMNVNRRTYDTTAILYLGPACRTVVSARVGKIYCWSTIVGAHRDTAVEHVWYWEEREMARVRLPVHGPKWRTWSSKRIDPRWTGTWRVEILAADGTPLDIRFLTVKTSPSATSR